MTGGEGMDPNVHAQLLDAAEAARLEGWLSWELPEIVFAAARRLDVPLSLAQARAIAAEVLPDHDHD